MFDWIESVAQRVAEAVNDTIGPVASYLEHYVWSWPEQPLVPLLVVLLLGTGVYVTLRLVFVQVRGFRHAVDITRGKYDNPKDEGDLNHFQALTTALSATVGIGNIAGVAIAIRMGGPGALLWMWLTAFLGMAVKYVECTLALMYRKVHPDGSVSGGPMYYIEMGLGRRWKWMATLFAAFAVLASFGGGCMNQSNTLADQVRSQFGIPTVITAVIFTSLVAAVIIGGIRRIGRVTSILAPSMAILYVVGALIILIVNFRAIPGGLALIVTQAFAPEPLVGGAVGSIYLTMIQGIRRGLFSNEAGQGSAPFAHATAKTKEPVREGLVASLGPFIDTIVICTMTGLVIVMTGAYAERVEQRFNLAAVEAVVAEQPSDEQLISLRASRASAGPAEIAVSDGRLIGAALVYLDSVMLDVRLLDASDQPWSGQMRVGAADGALTPIAGAAPARVQARALLTGAPLTALAFRRTLGGAGDLVVTLAVILFAVSTGISWSYYGDRATEYLFGSQAIKVYRWVFIGFFFMGSILPLRAVWTYGDVALGLMSFPNLLAVVFLTGGVVAATRAYFSKTHTPYR